MLLLREHPALVEDDVDSRWEHGPKCASIGRWTSKTAGFTMFHCIFQGLELPYMPCFIVSMPHLTCKRRVNHSFSGASSRCCCSPKGRSLLFTSKR